MIPNLDFGIGKNVMVINNGHAVQVHGWDSIYQVSDHAPLLLLDCMHVRERRAYDDDSQMTSDCCPSGNMHL